MPPDLVYILGHGSKWQNNEIRYSLRSAAKNLPHGKVFVIGCKPEFLNVEHIPAPDPYDHKTKNAIFKMLLACLNPAVSDPFILMNDDFFVLKPMPEVVPYSLGPLQKYIAEHKTQRGYYFQGNIDTMQALREAGIANPLSYEVHWPIVFEKKKLLGLIRTLDWQQTGYLLRSVYYNVYPPHKIEQVPDVKAYHIEDLKRLKNGRLISTNDRVVLHHEFQEWISDKFPEPSPYEYTNDQSVEACKIALHGKQKSAARAGVRSPEPQKNAGKGSREIVARQQAGAEDLEA